MEWSPGVMQADFGLAQAVVAGSRTDVHCLVASFPYSNMRYAVALPGENAECVRRGAARGVRAHRRRAAGAGARTTPPARRTGSRGTGSWWWRCSRGSSRITGSRSGSAIRARATRRAARGNAVGFLRRNVMVPLPNAESHAQLTRFMLSRCDRIAEDPHYRKGEPVRDLFARDREAMAPMPGTRFDACRWEVRKADGEGCVSVDSHRYLAGPSWRGWTLDVGLRAFDAGDPHP